MAEPCSVDASISRKIQSQILQRLASVGQVHVGNAIGKSETWVSRFASEQLKSCADLLACLGLKVVPAEHKCYDPAHIEHLHYFAQLGLKQGPAPVRLDFEDDE
jgi:hypothetical protein